MSKLKGMAGALVMAFCASVSQSHAATYSAIFDGTIYDLNATITTNATDDILSISGFMSGPQFGAITGLIAVGDPQGLPWSYNNKFFGTSPEVDNSGFLISLADLSLANLYFNGSVFLLSVANPDIGNYNPGDIGTLTVSEVPVPPALLLFASGLLGLGVVARGRRKNASATAA